MFIMGFLESWVCGELQLYYKKPYLLTFWRMYCQMKPKKQIHLRIPLWWPDISNDWKSWLPSKGNVLFTLLAIGILITTQAVWARPTQSPTGTSTSTISYQGRLVNSDGNPITAEVNMEFRIYSVPSGGTFIWEEYRTGNNAVDVSDGLFSVMLGSLNPDLPSAISGYDELYLGITVGTDNEMLPRVQLGTVPFSMQALTVADGSVTTEKIANGAVTSKKLGVGKYYFHRADDTKIHYRGVSGEVTTLDLDSCSLGQWCCNSENTICYLSRDNLDSILAFSLIGSESAACTLLHFEDDEPKKSKGIYFSTDDEGPIGGWEAFLSRDGYSGIPIETNTRYYWFCP